MERIDSARGDAGGRRVFASDHVSIHVEEELQVMSIRGARHRRNDDGLRALCAVAGLAMPTQPHRIEGCVMRNIQRIEPHAWILSGTSLPDARRLPAEWMATPLQAGLCVFRIVGLLAENVLLSECNVCGLEVGHGLRLPFAQGLVVGVQRLAIDDFRLWCDTSLADFVEERLWSAATDACRFAATRRGSMSADRS